MVTPLATAQDVKDEIPTGLEDSLIEKQIQKAADQNDRVNGIETQTDDEQTAIEATLAALRIATRFERGRLGSDELEQESGTIRFSESLIDDLRRAVDRLDESGKLAGLARRDSGRYTGYTNE